MARFYFSNNDKTVRNFLSHCESVGFDKYSIHSYDGRIFGATFKKLCIDNQNTLNIGDNLISVVGTFIYKREIGDKALRLIYDDFEANKDIISIRDKMTGHFAMVVVYEGLLYAISDNLGVHYLYYYTNSESGEWMIGTSLYEMAKVAPFTCHVDEFNLIEECYSHCVYGDETIFQEFNKVTGEKYCKVNLNNGAFEVLEASKPQFLIDNRSFEEITNDLSKELTAYGEMLKNTYMGGVALCMTGGIDARLTLATLLNVGIKPTLYYGIGNSKLTNTKAGDLEVDKMLASELGLQLQLMDYKNEGEIGERWDVLVDKYGFLDHFSTVTPNLKKEFKSISQPLQIWNFFGELFRNINLVEKEKGSSLTVDEILSKHYLYESYLKLLLGEKFTSYRQHVYEKIHKILCPYLDKEGNLPIEYFVVYDYYRRINCDTHKMNMCNQYRYCLAPLGDWRFMRYMTTPVHMRDDAKLMLKTIDKLYPELLEIPFFSHQHWRKYNKDAIKLDIAGIDKSKEVVIPKVFMPVVRSFHNTKIWQFFRKVKPMVLFLKNPRGFKEIQNRSKRQHQRESFSQYMIYSQLKKLCKNYPDFIYKIDPSKTDYLPKDAHLVLLLYTLDKLNVKIQYH